LNAKTEKTLAQKKKKKKTQKNLLNLS
jgi:hypothetical protein